MYKRLPIGLLSAVCLVLTHLLPPGAAHAQYFDHLWSNTYNQLREATDMGNFSHVVQDSQGNVYLYTSFKDTFDIDPGPDITLFGTAPNALGTAALAKYGPDGSLLWSFLLKSTVDRSSVHDLVLDEANNRLGIVGWFQGNIDMDPGTANQSLTTTSGTWSFLAAYDLDGNYLAARRIGTGASGSSCKAVCVTVDAEDNWVIGGSYYGTVDFDLNGTQQLPSGTWDPFLVKYSPTFELLWVFNVAATYGTFWDLELLSDGSIVGCGAVEGNNCDFDPGPGSSGTSTSNSEEGGFLVRYEPSSALVWVQALQAGIYTRSTFYNVEVGPDDGLVVTGLYSFSGNGAQLDLDPGPGEQIHTEGFSGHGGIIEKFHSDGTFAWAHVIEDELEYYGHTRAIIHNGTVLLAGGVWDNEAATLLQGADVTFGFNPCGEPAPANIVGYILALDTADGAVLWAGMDTTLCDEGSVIYADFGRIPGSDTLAVLGYFAGQPDLALGEGVAVPQAMNNYGGLPIYLAVDVFVTRTVLSGIPLAAPLPSAEMEPATSLRNVRLVDAAGRSVTQLSGPVPLPVRAVDHWLIPSLPAGIYVLHGTDQLGRQSTARFAVVE